MPGSFLRRFNWKARPTALLTAIATATFASPVWAAAATTIAVDNDGMLQIIARADPVVKSVMAILTMASVTTWALWIIKSKELRRAKDCLRRDIKTIAGASTFEEARSCNYRVTLEMVDVAATELKRAGDHPTHRQLEGIEERVTAQLPMVEARAMHCILSGTNILASIGAIAPFVGLAGTVWGIMNSFLGISKSQSTSLAVVAPGIAEALMATAIGLAAAIPAVLIYNSLSRSIAGYRRLLNEMAVLAACVLSRESERVDEREAELAVARERPARFDTRPTITHSSGAR